MKKRHCVALLILVALLAGPALAGKVLENSDNSLDGIYKADRLKNKTKDETYKDVEINIEGKYVEIRLPTRVNARIDQFYDWGYEMELTAHDKENGDMWIIKYQQGSKANPY